MLTLVTYTFNDHEFARNTLERFASCGNIIQTAIVVDDGSSEPFTVSAMPSCPWDVKILRHATNLGPAAAKCTGIGHADTQLILSVDSDIVCDRVWLPSALSVMSERPNVGLAGALPVATDHGDTLSRALHARSLFQRIPERPLFASGEIWLLRKAAYDSVQGLEGYAKRTHEDWHLCRKMTQAGYDIVLHQTGRVRQTRKMRRGAQVRRDAVYYFQSYKNILETRGPETILRVFTDEMSHSLRIADSHDAHILIYVDLAKILLVLSELHQGEGRDVIFTDVFRSFATVFKPYPAIMQAVMQDLCPLSLQVPGSSGPAPYVDFFGYLAELAGKPRLEILDRTILPRSFAEESEKKFDFHYLL